MRSLREPNAFLQLGGILGSGCGRNPSGPVVKGAAKHSGVVLDAQIGEGADLASGLMWQDTVA